LNAGARRALRFLKRALRKHVRNLVMLRVRFHYVSKPAIFWGLGSRWPFEIEVPIEFQGLGGASQRRFPCEFGKLKRALSWQMKIRTSRA
jgi:hypothetical protein